MLRAFKDDVSFNSSMTENPDPTIAMTSQGGVTLGLGSFAASFHESDEEDALGRRFKPKVKLAPVREKHEADREYSALMNEKEPSFFQNSRMNDESDYVGHDTRPTGGARRPGHRPVAVPPKLSKRAAKATPVRLAAVLEEHSIREKSPNTSANTVGDVSVYDGAAGNLKQTAKNGMTLREQEQVIDELTKENFDLKLRIFYFEERMKKTEPENVNRLVQENIELKTEFQGMRMELKKMKKRVNGEDKNQQAREEELARVRDELERAVADMEELRGENEELRQEAAELAEEIELLKSNHMDANSNAEIVHLREKIAEQEAIMGDLANFEDENNERKVIISDLECEIEELKRLLSESEDHLQKALDSQKGAQNSESELRNDLNRVQHELDVLRGEKAELERRLLDLEEQKASLECNVQTAQRKAGELEKSLDNQNQTLHIESEEKARHTAKYRREIEEKNRQISELRADVAEEKQASSSAEKQIDRLKGELAEVKRALQREEDGKISRVEQSSLLEKELSDAKKALSKVEKELSQNKKLVKALRSDLENNTRRFDAAQSNKVVSLELELESLKSDFDDAQLRMKELEKQTTDSEKAAREALEKEGQARSTLEVTLRESKESNKEHVSVLARKDKELDDLKKELRSAKSHLQSELKNMSADGQTANIISQCKARIEYLEGKLREAIETNATLQKKANPADKLRDVTNSNSAFKDELNVQLKHVKQTDERLGQLIGLYKENE